MSSKKGSIIVTGANGGLGRGIVSKFLSSPESSFYKGLWAVRDPAKAMQLLDTLGKFSNATEHEIVQIDISTTASVRASAADINSRVAAGSLPPIKALVLNAALQFVTGQTYTDERLEKTLAVNFLSNFLLAALLMQSMDKEMGRIVIVSSWMHDTSHPLRATIDAEEQKTIFRGNLELLAKPAKDKEGDDYNAGMRRYGASKTLLIMIMYELQCRLSASKEHSNCCVLAVDPGAMPGTELLRDSSSTLNFVIRYIMGPITPLLTYFFPNGYFRTPQKSAKDVLNACFDERTIGKHPKGVYLNGSAVIQSSPETRDEAKQRELWKQTVEMAGLKPEETILDIKT